MRFVLRWLQIVAAAIVIITVGWLVASHTFHLRLLDVQTGSMSPVFKPGDALIMQKSKEVPQVGDIVSYYSSRNPNELVTHRVIKLGGGSFQTQGDALSTPDPVLRESLLAGKVVASLPGMGRALSWVQTWPGLIATVYIPASAVVIAELIRLEKHFGIRTYRLRQSVLS